MSAVPVIVVFRPKAGEVERTAALVASHAAILHAAGFASARPAWVLRAADGSYVELFEWQSAERMAAAAAMLRDPSIGADDPSARRLRAMWADLAEACDYVPLASLPETASLFARFAPVETDTNWNTHMNLIDTPLADHKLIQCKVYGDAASLMVERLNVAKLAEAGFEETFVQDNHARTAPGVLRGLHFQHAPARGMLTGAITGAIWDVAVDLRPASPSFGRWHGATLTGENGLLAWIPPGFAHGFVVLGDVPSDTFYKVTQYHNPQGDGWIAWDDPELAIEWPVTAPILNAHYASLPSFAAYKAAPPTW